MEDLYIFEKQGYDEYEEPCWQDDIENSLWLDLLRSFVALKNLYLSKEFAPRIVPTLQELVGGRTTKVLPTLENIFLEGFQPSGPLYEGIERFVAARQLTSHPVAVSRWDGDLKQQVISGGRSIISDYRSFFVLLTFLVVSLPPRFSFALVFLDITTTMVDIRRLITCVG